MGTNQSVLGYLVSKSHCILKRGTQPNETVIQSVPPLWLGPVDPSQRWPYVPPPTPTSYTLTCASFTHLYINIRKYIHTYIHRIQIMNFSFSNSSTYNYIIYRSVEIDSQSIRILYSIAPTHILSGIFMHFLRGGPILITFTPNTV